MHEITMCLLCLCFEGVRGRWAAKAGIGWSPRPPHDLTRDTPGAFRGCCDFAAPVRSPKPRRFLQSRRGRRDARLCGEEEQPLAIAPCIFESPPAPSPYRLPSQGECLRGPERRGVDEQGLQRGGLRPPADLRVQGKQEGGLLRET